MFVGGCNEWDFMSVLHEELSQVWVNIKTAIKTMALFPTLTNLPFGGSLVVYMIILYLALFHIGMALHI